MHYLHNQQSYLQRLVIRDTFIFQIAGEKTCLEINGAL